MGNSKKTKDEWNIYWSRHAKKGKTAYSSFAEFYRKNVIRKALAYFLRKEFRPGSVLLHAGCGSGQVDEGLHRSFRITALDISKKALDMYRKTNPKKARVMLGSIFRIPSKDSAYDGIYNLGVMEHFTRKDIGRILLEFRRVLKKKGKLVIFWPPRFGPTVIMLKIIHFILNSILRRKTMLHPAEISLIRSKKQAAEIFGKAGFRIKRCYFGPRDAFTHMIIVAEKLSA
jgi:ubiquinone/menaquinone biosynthesis C-methylase UbiE